MVQKVGDNITVHDKGDYFLFKVKKDAKQQESANGRTKILASSKGFVTIENDEGDHLDDVDIGLSMVVTLRPKKTKEKKKATTKKTKARMDDD